MLNALSFICSIHPASPPSVWHLMPANLASIQKRKLRAENVNSNPKWKFKKFLKFNFSKWTSSKLKKKSLHNNGYSMVKSEEFYCVTLCWHHSAPSKALLQESVSWGAKLVKSLLTRISSHPWKAWFIHLNFNFLRDWNTLHSAIYSACCKVSKMTIWWIPLVGCSHLLPNIPRRRGHCFYSFRRAIIVWVHHLKI